MCGRYTVTRADEILREFDVALDLTASAAPEWTRPRFNVAPTQPAPVVVLRDGARTLELMRWGLVPHWGAQPGAKAPLMINARVESVNGKQVYRDGMARHRCLVVADGFLEWSRADPKKPRPYWFHRDDGALIAFAGLTARAGDLRSFTILTGEPNPLVAPVHDRMPVVLAREAWAAWLDPAVGAEDARALLSIPPHDGWRADAVSTRVNSAAHDDPACLAPAEPAQPLLL